MGPKAWGKFESLAARNGAWSALAGAVVAYGPLLLDYDFGRYTGLVALIVGGMVSLAKLWLDDNGKAVSK